MKEVSDRGYGPFRVKLAAGVNDCGKEFSIHPDADVDTRVNQRHKSVEAFIHLFAGASGGVDDRISIRPQPEFGRNMRKIFAHCICRNFNAEIALEKQPLPKNLRSNIS